MVGFWKTVVKLNSFDVIIKRFLMELNGQLIGFSFNGFLLYFQLKKNLGVGNSFFIESYYSINNHELKK